ncbi:MAG: class I SAM-dependent methyltransferase, partial [Candidatus Adiutricales bacterium]
MGRRLKYRLFANSIKKHFPKHQLINLLEIGCGQGDLQRAIKHDERIKGVGLDLDKSALNYARSLDLDVREGTLEEQNFLSKTYDCVVAI